MKIILFCLCFVSMNVFSQGKTKEIALISYDNFQDTILRDYSNEILIHGILGIKGITVEAVNAELIRTHKTYYMYIIKPSAYPTCELIIKKDNKEVFRETIVVRDYNEYKDRVIMKPEKK